jgi:hypothetical protein
LDFDSVDTIGSHRHVEQTRAQEHGTDASDPDVQVTARGLPRRSSAHKWPEGEHATREQARQGASNHERSPG